MALVFCSHLQPRGPSGLAAIRFACLIRVSKLRIFPKGASLFENARHIQSETHPDAFYLDVFFNAQPVGTDGKDRQRATNALVPTSVSYPGGLMDFVVDMGPEYATRLMIVKGTFDRLSLAIYGQIVSDSPPVLTYEPKVIVPFEPEPLSAHLDPAHASDPTALAKSLLELIPNAPSLSLAIRLVFCLKPTLDDWDIPGFPHIYASLDNDSEDYDLDSIVANLDRPIPEDVTQESLDRFVERLTDFIGSPSVDQAYQIANVLNLSASQSPLFSQALLGALDLSSIFTSITLADTPTLKTLTDACSNALIARHFLTQTTLLNTLDEMRDNSRFKPERALISSIMRLQTRILGWQAFEDALSHSDGDNDWSRPVGLVYDVCREEQALGNWLASMIIHDDLLVQLAQHPPPPTTTTAPNTPPMLFGRDADDDDECELVTHDDFIAFVRACIGVVAVLGVLAWADSVGNVDCRERTLAVIHLWQTVDGYREIVNHLFLLRQLTRRLNWIITDKTTDNDPPRHSGLLAERVLCSLLLPPIPSSHPYPHPIPFPPSSMSTSHSHNYSHPILPALNLDLTQTILSLSQPLALIPEHERLAFRKLALVVDDGLLAAVEELVLVFNSHSHHLTDENGNVGGTRRPISLRRVRILRVGVGLVLRELTNDGSGLETDGGEATDGEGVGGEWRVLEAFGAERTFGFVERLVDLFGDLVEDLMEHFVKDHGGPLNLGAIPAAANGSGSANATRVGTDTSGYRQNQDLIEQLFATTREFLLLIHRLAIKAFALTTRGLRRIVSGIVDLVGCADSVLNNANNAQADQGGQEEKRRKQQQTNIKRVARKTRKTCIWILKGFAKENVVVEPRKKRCATEVVLRSLLVCGQIGDSTRDQTQQVRRVGQDDVLGRIERVLELIECVLPSGSTLEGGNHRGMDSPTLQEREDDRITNDDDSSLSQSQSQNQRQQLQELKRTKAHWAMNVLPLVLSELRLFMRLLPVEAQVRFVLLLVDIDGDGDVGVGEWLVEEEVKEASEVLGSLMGGYPLLDGYSGNEHGVMESVEGVGDVETEVKGEAMEGVEGVDVGEKGKGKEKFVEEQRRRREMKMQKEREKEVIRAGRMVNLYRVYVCLQFLWLLASSPPWFLDALIRTPTLTTHLTTFLTFLLEGHYTSPPFTSLLKFLSQSNLARLKLSPPDETLDRLKVVVLIGVLRVVQGDVTSENVGDDYVKEVIKDEGVKSVLFSSFDNGEMVMEQSDALVDAVRFEVGRLCAVCSENVGMVSLQVAEMVIAVLQWIVGYSLTKSSTNDDNSGGTTKEKMPTKMKILRGVTREAFSTLCDSFIIMFTEVEQQQAVHEIQARIGFDEDEDFIPIPIELPDVLVLSLSSVSSLLFHSRSSATTSSSSHTRNGSLSTFSFSGGLPSGQAGGRPSTPKGGQKTPDILGTIISPPAALLRSPAATGLTKTYMNNDFRSLRQVPSARLNTSRLPSMHVDDFESGAVGMALPGTSTSPLVVPVPIPIGDPSAFGGLLNMGQ